MGKCETCKKVLMNEPYLEAVIPSGKRYLFCHKCIKMGLASLKRIPHPDPSQKDLMIKFEGFLRKVNKARRIAES